jgi:hypothetical protein
VEDPSQTSPSQTRDGSLAFAVPELVELLADRHDLVFDSSTGHGATRAD